MVGLEALLTPMMEGHRTAGSMTLDGVVYVPSREDLRNRVEHALYLSVLLGLYPLVVGLLVHVFTGAGGSGVASLRRVTRFVSGSYAIWVLPPRWSLVRGCLGWLFISFERVVFLYMWWKRYRDHGD